MKIWIPIKGGYLSTCMESEHPIGFAAYCRMREKSIDPRFREDEYYGFFTQQIKELIELKRSKQIYSRQIKRNPTLTQAAIEHQRMDELEKVNKNFSVYKNIRGTTMYYDSVKKNAMAYICQLGSPHLFYHLFCQISRRYPFQAGLRNSSQSSSHRGRNSEYENYPD